MPDERIMTPATFPSATIPSAPVLTRVQPAVWPLRLAIVLALAATVLFRTSNNAVDLDLWHQLAFARDLVTFHHFPVVDHYSYTSTIRPYIHHEWGTGLLLYTILTHFGTAGILLLKYALLCAVLAVCFACAGGRRARVEILGLACLAALWLLTLGFGPFRAQMFTYLFSAVLLWCLQRDDAGDRRWIFAFPLVFPIWVNLHGGCAIGIALVGIAWIEKVISRKRHFHLLCIAGVLSVLLAVTPYGLSYVLYLWRALSMPRPRITEWQMLVQRADITFLVAYGICVMALLYASIDSALRRRKLSFGVLILFFLSVQAYLHVKFIPLFGIASLCYLPDLLQTTPLGRKVAAINRDWRDLAAGTWLIWFGLLLLTAINSGAGSWDLLVPGEPVPKIEDSRTYPVGAVNYLHDHRFTGRLMTPFDYGAYVSWRLFPLVRVSLDSRYEAVYSEEVFNKNLDFYSAKAGWQSTLSRYPTDAVLVPTAEPVAAHMTETGWNRVYSDSHFEVYVPPDVHLRVVKWRAPVPDGTIF